MCRKLLLLDDEPELELPRTEGRPVQLRPSKLGAKKAR